MTVIITKHAEDRLMQRSGITKKSVQRMAEKAFNEGIQHKDTKGNLNKWLTKVYFKNKSANNLRVYGDKVYVFTNEKLVTVLQIPSDITKDMKRMIK